MCRAAGLIVPATAVDHIKPHRGDYNSFVLGDLQSLCQTSANRTKEQIEVCGYALDIGADGLPTDRRHPFWSS
jgi:hypothetical protein